MRIISPFQDYYDGVQQHGYDDRSLVYDRRTVEHQIERGHKHKPKPPFLGDDVLPPFHWERPNIEYVRANSRGWRDAPSRAMLYFCGKAYPFWIAMDHRRYNDYPRVESKKVYSFEAEFNDLVQDKASSWWWDDRFKISQAKHVDWLAKHTGIEIDPAIHFKYKSPILLYLESENEPVLIVNPCLKDYAIQKVIDPYSAFQEIDMFLGGVLGSIEKDGPPMTDVQKVSSHGMDPKWSFRKKSESKK
jgi:hypothetical protein